jgi:aspartate/methionine/tyrosine aminotransferase
MRLPERVRAIEQPQFDLLNNVAARWRARGADVINLGQALPGFAPPTVAIEAFHAAVNDASSHVYSADAGTPELRAALTRSLATLGGQVDPEREVIITAGANQAFQLLLLTLIDPGDEVILPGPYFLNHEMAVRSVSATPVEAPLPAERHFTPTWDDIAPHVTSRTRALVLVSPSNPTGAVVGRAELHRIVDACAARGVLVIVDETYLHFVYDGEPVTATALPQWSDNVAVVGSFSKSFAITGWRCGYLLAGADVIAEALKIQDCMVICAPVPVQRAVTAILDREPDHPRGWLAELRERRDWLMQALTASDLLHPVHPAGGFFIMVRVAGCRDSRQLALDLIEHQQVVVIPGRFFGESGEGYLRVSYGAARLDRLREAAARIADFVQKQPVG